MKTYHLLLASFLFAYGNCFSQIKVRDKRDIDLYFYYDGTTLYHVTKISPHIDKLKWIH